MADATQKTATPLKHLDRALGALRDLGLVKGAPSPAPVVAILDKLTQVDPEAAAAVARTLAQATVFNEVVREQITAVRIADRYRAIAEAFNSIRDDAKTMVAQIEDGKLSTGERLANVWMKVTRGDVPSRFAKIKQTYLEVAGDSKDQIQREQVVLKAYADFRSALKEGQVLALGIQKKAEARVKEAKKELEKAAKAVATDKRKDPEATARLELARDLGISALQDEDKRYQVAKDLAENLAISYSTSEVVMARLHQITNAKERVYEQAVTFFGTNETVFTALSASFTGMTGLHESTQTLEAMKKGMNESLETLGQEGTKIQDAALRAGYGPTIRAASVKKLVDAVTDYQERSLRIIDEMRVLATKNAEEVTEAVESGKRRMVDLEQRVAALPEASAAS